MNAQNPLKKYWQGGKFKRLPFLNGSAPVRVDIRHNPYDILVCLLGSCGFSSACIAERTHFSPGQIAYRLKKGNISRQNYRNGKSPYALRILNASPSMILPQLQPRLTQLQDAAEKKNQIESNHETR